MIRARTTAEGTVLDAAGLGPGDAYYLDADWLPADRSSLDIVPIVVEAGVPEADDVAGGILVQLAERAAAAVGSAESAVVMGSGTVARHVRGVLAMRGIEPREDAAPAVVVEATGAPSSIADALREVRTLGTIVLIGEQLDRECTLDLYSDLHVRGLRVVGLARPPLAAPDGARLPDPVRAELAPVTPGMVLPKGAGWYRLSR
jgi:hypothetical protein